MPHTSHRKKQSRVKRTNVVDENGWTRVANVGVNSQLPNSLLRQPAVDKILPIANSHHNASTPADGTTIEKVYAQFQEIEKRWLKSTAWHTLDHLLRKVVDRQTLDSIQTAIVVGTGSFCGVGHGFVERFEVSLYQLAAFKAVLDTLENVTGYRPRARAQDPIYNDLDMELLKRLTIETVHHPIGLQEITPQTFVYAPCAELMVEVCCLEGNPSLALLTGKLDFLWRNERGAVCTNRMDAIQYESEEVVGADRSVAVAISQQQTRLEKQLNIVETFLHGKTMSSLPELDVKDFPFHDVYLYSQQPFDEAA